MDVIIYKEGDAVHRVVCAEGVDINAEAIKVVPNGVTFKILDNDSMPSPVLRNAWDFDGGAVSVDLVKGKAVCNEIRRDKREEYMKENLELIQKDAAGIPLAPAQDVAAAKQDNADYKATVDDVAQTAIESATNESELLAALDIL